MIQQSTLQNGLQIVTEHIENVSVVAIHCGIPAGIATNLLDGQSAILAELIQRGAQGLSAQEHNESLDLLGVRKHVNCGNEFMFMSGVMLSSVFEEALSLLCGYVLDPEMPESDLLACKQLCLQAIASLADDPSSQASIAANLYHHPAPFNRSGLGSASIIEHTSMVDLHDLLRTRFLPEGSIFSIAGNVSHEDAVIVIDRATSSWKGSTAPTEETDPPHSWSSLD